MSESDYLPLDPHPPGIEGKVADEPTIIRWVAANIAVERPDPYTCPAPFAWTLLRQCRDDPAFVPWFIDKLWSKLIPSKAQLEQTGPKALDGQHVIDLITQIEMIAEDSGLRTKKSRSKKKDRPERLLNLPEGV